MNFDQTLDYLYSKLPMFTRIGAAALKKDLTNTLLLCEALGNPQHKFRSVHIAGTNGKGSTSSMLAAVFQQAGYKCGLYTSPHLVRFTERIRINGLEMDKQAVVDFVAQQRELIERVQPSFFEVTVAMAFDYFARQGVDIAVIEVGLGGRLDSTNVITPELSVITNIAYDHTDLLGETLAEIAGEKAGIIKKGVPVVIGETHNETQAVFLQKAQQEQAPIYFTQDHYKAQIQANNLFQQHISLESPNGNEDYLLDLTGSYQQHNLLTVLQAAEVLRGLGWQLSPAVVKEALSQVKTLTGLRGRMQVLQADPLVLCDVGHNEAGIAYLMQQLLQLYPPEQLQFVWGMVRDKNHDKVLRLLPKAAGYHFVSPQIPRGLPAQEMQEKAANFGLHGRVYNSVREGYEAAKAEIKRGEMLFVGGSTFVVAEVL